MRSAERECLRVQLLSPDRLSNDLMGVWRSHQLADHNLRGPFFSPEYICSVAEARPDVTIAVVEMPGHSPAFFPFHCDRSKVARPVGLRACDFSGLIAARGHAWSPQLLVRSCGLSGWEFKNVVTSDETMRPYFRAFADSPYVDLRGGFEIFAKERRNSGSNLVRSVAQKSRKMERELGPVRFEVNTRDRRALDLLFEWKAAQRQRTGTVDVLATSWMRRTIERLLETNTATFAGLLSVLYVGNQVAAVHMGMRSDTIWHYWFAAYNHDLQRYSPGLINLFQMVKSAPALGIETITLGRGDEPYKLRFATGSTQLASGSVDCRLTRRLTTAIWYAARNASQRSPVVAALAKSVKRRGRWMFEGTQ
jgi:CelD/BcsL family acetyltransferase involved in cellulose biosynthesis